MTFREVLAQVIDWLQQDKRVSYRAIKREFDIDDDYIEDLKEELIEVRECAVDRDKKMLVWTGETGYTPEPTSPSEQTTRPDTQEAEPTLGETQPAETHTPDAAERRQLTVMFCDLVGSTELSGQMDAEDYREVVRAYQATCADVIERFDCHIAQTLGDGLLVYSGYPVAHENDAERAVRVGLGIIQSMKALNERLDQDKGIRLGVRVGIHTGLVVVGEVGAGTRQEQLALGETPNIAARIQGLAKPDTVLISSDTYRLIQDYFDCEALGEHDLRGVSQPIAVYRVLRESGVQNRLDVASTRGLTPLVGREQEVGLLLERWVQCRDGHGQVILLSGEAGIGKSRLVQALKDHVADEPHAQEECRCSPYHSNSAFFPLAELLQRKLGWQPGDGSDEKLRKLETSLAQTHLDVEKTVPLFTVLLSLPLPDDRYPPIQLLSQQQRQQTLEACLQLILLAAEQHPVLFIVEDLNWADPSTLEFLELLIDQTPTTSIFMLLTCRPEFQPTWSHRSYLTEVSLNRLSRPQIAQIATQVANGKALPVVVVEQLVDKTDGVPLYVEEMTKSVLESGVLKEANGQYELSGPLSSLAIPATLQDSLMGRLDRLMTAKVVAQLGATIGRQFSYELLQAVSELDEATLQRELGRLVDAELVYPRGLPPHATYTFKHALIQDTAYESLLRSTRQGYHRRIAEVLEERLPQMLETQPELVAHHFTEAGLHEQAVAYWQEAGAKAIQRSAQVEAITHLTQGVELLNALPETPERARREFDIQIMLGPVLMATRGNAAPEVELAYDRARELCVQIGKTVQLFPVLWGLWVSYQQRAAFETARKLGDELLDLAQRTHEPSLLLQAHHALWTTLYTLGDLTSVQPHLEYGITVYNPELHHSHILLYGGHDTGVCCRAHAAPTLWLLGYPDQSMNRLRDALNLSQDLEHPLSAVHALYYAVVVHQYRREASDVQRYADMVLRLSTEQGFQQRLAQGTILRGWALAAQGQGTEGLFQMEQGLSAYQATRAERERPYYFTLAAEAYATGGQLQKGLDLLSEAQSIVESSGEGLCEAEIHRLKGQLLLQQSPDNAAEAEACFQQAITIAQNQSAKSWELRAATSLARLYQQQGKRDEARDLLEPVYSWLTEGHDTADLKDAKALLDELA